MTKLSTFFIALTLSAGVVGNAAAATLDDLQGAWTMDGTQCPETFKKVNDKVDFIDRGSSLTTGIIIDGKTVLGPNGTCTVASMNDKGDTFSAHLSCSDAITFSDFSVSFKVIDATHFERFDPAFSSISETYEKCDP